MVDPNVQQLAELAQRIGTPLWRAALRQVWVSVVTESLWAVGVTVATVLVVRACNRAIRKEQDKSWGDEDFCVVGRAAAIVLVTLAIGLLVSDVLSMTLNPTYAAVHALGALVP